jgi:hypothetical protein
MRHDHDARQPAAGYARKVELRSIKEGEEMLSGEHEEKEEEKGKHFLRRERRYGSFSRMPLTRFTSTCCARSRWTHKPTYRRDHVDTNRL